MKVLLVDDHDALLTALKQVIRGLGDDVTVVASEPYGIVEQTDTYLRMDGDQAVDAARASATRGQIVVLDAAGAGELAGITRLAFDGSALPVVVVSASSRSSDVIRAIDHGAMGFVPRRASSAMLFDALRLVMSGGT